METHGAKHPLVTPIEKKLQVTSVRTATPLAICLLLYDVPKGRETRPGRHGRVRRLAKGWLHLRLRCM